MVDRGYPAGGSRGYAHGLVTAHHRCGYRGQVRVILRSVLADVVLAVVLTGLSLATLGTMSTARADWLGYLLAALSIAPVALRQRAPLTITLVMCGALVAYLVLGYGDFPSGGVGLLIGLFSVAVVRPWPMTLLALLSGLSVVVVSYSSAGGHVVWPQVCTAVVHCLAACVLGESTKRWSRRVEGLAEQAARAVVEERGRIAHELHDVVAHHMSVISLQAGLAEYVIDSDPRVAREALATVGTTSREALAEMRRLLDVLRVDQAGTLSPQPGLSELDGLLDRLRGTGLRVDLAVTGTRRPLPPGPDLCAYRVAQESLTNVLKHAGPATARLDLDYGEHTLTVKITDDGRGDAAAHSATAPRGIAGMRERTELYGGVLTAGPRPEGGFAVVLRLPYAEVS
ncbi:two-component system sensor kinase [Kutzneria albida DSM 43870]|uniref:histidine kinase n=1 Tax=Kutzneria albida DSM 43870 TaxID=1449976 RepID=W5W7H6_9PSEU|nr:two-component system sensor kinase [Kutzneria albida DSM 43870]